MIEVRFLLRFVMNQNQFIMRALIFLIVVTGLLSCQEEQEPIKETIDYSGTVYSYQEEAGEEVNMSEEIFVRGQPIEGAEVSLEQIQYESGGTCCWSSRSGSKQLCYRVTDRDGHFGCLLTESVDDYTVKHNDYEDSRFVNLGRPEGYIVMFNTTKVAINVIDTLLELDDGIDIFFNVGHSSHAYRGANFRYNEGEIIDGVRYSTDTINLMENVNMNLSIRRGDDRESIRIYTGNNDDIQTVTVYN